MIQYKGSINNELLIGLTIIQTVIQLDDYKNNATIVVMRVSMAMEVAIGPR
jgi:hypothetical protein